MSVQSNEPGVSADGAALAEQERACHDLLVRLAGRVPDRLLWRLRDWLAAGAHTSLASTLPRSLLRHRIGLTDSERDLLEASLLYWGAPRRSLDAVLPVTELVEPTASFQAELTPDRRCADRPAAGGTASNWRCVPCSGVPPGRRNCAAPGGWTTLAPGGWCWRTSPRTCRR
jgi:hypothetical protein